MAVRVRLDRGLAHGAGGTDHPTFRAGEEARAGGRPHLLWCRVWNSPFGNPRSGLCFHGAEDHLVRAWRPFPDRYGMRLEMVAVRRTLGAGVFSRRSEEHTSELQSLMRNSYAVFCM